MLISMIMKLTSNNLHYYPRGRDILATVGEVGMFLKLSITINELFFVLAENTFDKWRINKLMLLFGLKA